MNFTKMIKSYLYLNHLRLFLSLYSLPQPRPHCRYQCREAPRRCSSSGSCWGLAHLVKLSYLHQLSRALACSWDRPGFWEHPASCDTGHIRPDPLTGRNTTYRGPACQGLSLASPRLETAGWSRCYWLERKDCPAWERRSPVLEESQWPEALQPPPPPDQEAVGRWGVDSCLVLWSSVSYKYTFSQIFL